MATVRICVKSRTRGGKCGKTGREAGVYASWRIRPKRDNRCRTVYRSRFGIEADYRQGSQCRIRTTSYRFEVRFFSVTIGFLVRNLGVAGSNSSSAATEEETAPAQRGGHGPLQEHSADRRIFVRRTYDLDPRKWSSRSTETFHVFEFRFAGPAETSSYLVMGVSLTLR
jgi:hypothetical protein